MLPGLATGWLLPANPLPLPLPPPPPQLPSPLCFFPTAATGDSGSSSSSSSSYKCFGLAAASHCCWLPQQQQQQQQQHLSIAGTNCNNSWEMLTNSSCSSGQGKQQQQQQQQQQRKRRKAEVALSSLRAFREDTAASGVSSGSSSSSSSCSDDNEPQPQQQQRHQQRRQTPPQPQLLNNIQPTPSPRLHRAAASVPPAVRVIRNNLNLPAAAAQHHQQQLHHQQHRQLHHHQQQHHLARVHFASGSPVVLAAAAAAAAAATAAAAAAAAAASPSGSGSACRAQQQLLGGLRPSDFGAPSAVRLDLSGCPSVGFGGGASAGAAAVAAGSGGAAVAGVRAEVAFTGALEPATSAGGGRTSPQQQQQPHHHHQQHHFVQVQNPLCVPRQLDFLASWRTCMVPIVDLELFAFMKPPCPRWRHLASRSSPSGGGGSGRAALLFTLMCYNILSDQYASPKSYWYCPDWALTWNFRRQGILENIGTFLPTIVCLQEVETEQFYSFFLPHLSRRGYDGIFSPKTRAKTMDDRLRKRVDGCAIFWKRSQFRLVEEHVIEFSQQYLEHCWSAHWTERRRRSQSQSQTDADCLPADEDCSKAEQQQEDTDFSDGRGKASSEIFNRVTVRDNIALAVVLAPAASKTASKQQPDGHGHVMVCTSHMHWDPQCSDVKLIQTVVLTSALSAKIKQHCATTGADALPLILCGDFNSLPDSGVIEFLNQGSVERDHPEFQRLGQDPSLDGLKLVGDSPQSSFSHSLDLVSCYNSVDVSYTNFTPDFKGIIDYIFASRSHFRVLDCLEGMADWFKSEGVIGCPHPYVPSDHIPLLVQLELLHQPAAASSSSTPPASSV